jgi:para-nitrobenzyl esterase
VGSHPGHGRLTNSQAQFLAEGKFNSMLIRTSLRIATIALASAPLLAAPPASSNPAVSIETGILQGSLEGHLLAFKGIPYAAPPVGDLRWRPPQPAPHWTGTRPATSFGHDCMQFPAPSEAAPAGTTGPAEDCLVLNVWTPANAAHKHLPVMIWIYGGGFVNGSTSTPIYDGASFARDGIIFVSFNYRLGRFGFFAHPALSRVAGSEPLGNYGYMDQIAALQWVQRNIAAFGGDPRNVTIFGESAGGSSVQMLLASPASNGLFQKAIVQSGGGRDSAHPRHVLEADTKPGDPPSGESLGLTFAKSKGITGDDASVLTRLRALPADVLVGGNNILTRRVEPSLNATFPGPMIDGHIVVETTEAAYRAAHQKKIPLMIGANDNDLAYYSGNTVDTLLAPFGAARENARAIYDPDHTNDVPTVGLRVAADRTEIEPARFVARLLTQQGQPVYLFRFSYVADSMRSEWPGATHASEVPYVFETLPARYQSKATPHDESIAKLTHAYWVDFVKTGNPNGGHRTLWPLFTPSPDQILNITDNGAILEPDPFKARLDLTEQSH